MSTELREKIKHLIKQMFVISFSFALGLTLLAYAVDFLIYRYRVAANRQPFGQVTVSRYDAVAQKNGKTEFLFNPPEQQTCVNALFPRAGFVPCWYLRRHTEQRTDI